MRNLPVLIVAIMSGLVASMVMGFFLASWTTSGMGVTMPSTVERDRPPLAAIDDSWRKAGYEKIGLWEHAGTPD